MGPDDDFVLKFDKAIEEGDSLLSMDSVRPEDFRPRNALVTVRRLGKLADDKIGNILLPNSSSKFDVAEVINVGPGTPTDSGACTDTHDLRRGQKVLIKTESQPQPGVRATTTLKFRIGDGEIELMNQHDILAVINTSKESE